MIHAVRMFELLLACTSAWALLPRAQQQCRRCIYFPQLCQCMIIKQRHYYGGGNADRNGDRLNDQQFFIAQKTVVNNGIQHD